MKPVWWRSQRVFFASLTIFLASVFGAYVTVESDNFYRTGLVLAEFVLSLLSGALIGFVVYKYIDSGS